MRVTLEIPDREWWAIAGRAEKFGTAARSLLEHAVRDALGSEAKRLHAEDARRDRVLMLAREGMTNDVICERTGETRGYVQLALRRAGIKSNRQLRSNTEGTKE